METSVFVKEKMLEGLYDWKYRWEKEICCEIKKVGEADKVEEIMFYLQQLIRNVLYLPLGTDTCYFCLNENSCENCRYAKIHGICGTEKSDYSKISLRLNELLYAIDDFYKGEVYSVDLNKEVQSKLVRNLVRWFFTVNVEINECIEQIESSETVENIMMFKQKLLITLVQNLPLRYYYNYFCLKNKRCGECEYAKIHGVCSEEGSDVNKIEEAMKDLLLKLQDYYKGESYE